MYIYTYVYIYSYGCILEYINRYPIDFAQHGNILTRDSPHPTPSHEWAAADGAGGRHMVCVMGEFPMVLPYLM